MMGLVPLYEETPGSLLSPLCHVRTWEGSHLQPGRELSPGAQLGHTLMVNFPASERVRNQFGLSHRLWCFVMQLELTDTLLKAASL